MCGAPLCGYAGRLGSDPDARPFSGCVPSGPALEEEGACLSLHLDAEVTLSLSSLESYCLISCYRNIRFLSSSDLFSHFTF